MKVEAIVLCENAIQRPDGTIDCEGALPNPIHVPAPTDLPQMVVMVFVTDLAGISEIAMTVDLAYAGRRARAGHAHSAITPGSVRAGIGLGMKGVPLRISGKYQFDVTLTAGGETQVASFVWRVVVGGRN